MDSFHLSEDRDTWHAFVCMVVNLLASCKARRFSNTWCAVNFPRRSLLCGVTQDRQQVIHL